MVVPMEVEHRVVNHSVSFVSPEGWHTNAVECWNGKVKRFLHRYTGYCTRYKR